jgi:uncharacterized membrane protein (UPF0127 family)
MRRLLAGAAAVLLAAAVQCTPAPPAPSSPAGDETAAGAGPRVLFPDGFAVSVEIAANDELRAQGLMYRDRLRPGTGMLFFFEEPGAHSFWMKNTRIPLDMIWLDGQRRIVHIEANVPPCVADPCPSYGSEEVEALYVLEVFGGVAAEHGLKAGDVIRFEGLDDVVVE